MKKGEDCNTENELETKIHFYENLDACIMNVLEFLEWDENNGGTRQKHLIETVERFFK